MQRELTRVRSGLSAEHRFWLKVDYRPGPGCWEWRGDHNRFGYGVVSTGYGPNRHRSVAHRVSWQMAYGPIPEGMQVCHSCDNASCVRPSHLWLGTQGDNVQDMRTKGRGFNIPSRPQRGSLNPNTRLTETDVIQIRRMAGGGMRQVDIAAQFGINRATVSYIVRRRTWKHVA